ncbi:MAG: DUF4197 domain-containing protein [Bacteroidia bacterium]|nr:DUF4197 domain-containing protein [Bacteroidia bacterium]MDW8235649.1 DUF4197 domain-containing protein [Bacteroidia bacterium]
MKPIITPTLLLLGFILASCEKVKLPSSNPGLTEEEIVAGLKEALRVGVDTAVHYLNQRNGYYGDSLIRILFPPQAIRIKQTIEVLPGGRALVEDVVLRMNRAAEEAAAEAKPIFRDAITNLTITEGMRILKGDSIAATRHLKEKTYDSLYHRYKPRIQHALETVGAQQAWTDLTRWYLQIFPNDSVPTDLAAYTTDKALYGLFLKVGHHEVKIRRDVSYRVTELLRKVFAQATG